MKMTNIGTLEIVVSQMINFGNAFQIIGNKPMSDSLYSTAKELAVIVKEEKALLAENPEDAVFTCPKCGSSNVLRFKSTKNNIKQYSCLHCKEVGLLNEV